MLLVCTFIATLSNEEQIYCMYFNSNSCVEKLRKKASISWPIFSTPAALEEGNDST